MDRLDCLIVPVVQNFVRHSVFEVVKRCRLAVIQTDILVMVLGRRFSADLFVL